MKEKIYSIEQLNMAVTKTAPQLAELIKAAYKAGYEKGLKVSSELRPTKTLSKHNLISR